MIGGAAARGLQGPLQHLHGLPRVEAPHGLALVEPLGVRHHSLADDLAARVSFRGRGEGGGGGGGR